MTDSKNTSDIPTGKSEPTVTKKTEDKSPAPKEVGGRKDGLDPTRYGDWEKNGRCVDF